MSIAMGQDTRQQTEQRDFAFPDEVRAFGHGRLELLHVAESEIGRRIRTADGAEFDAIPGQASAD